MHDAHPYRRAATLAAALALLLTLTSGADARPSAASSRVRFKLMEFNIEDGGVIVRFASIAEAIRKADPDVVGIEEAQAHIPRLARAAGYPYYSVRLQILSRYPLIDPPGSRGLYVFVELSPGRVVALGNVHLPSNPYSPNVIKRGATPQKILKIERRFRLPFVEPTVRALSRLVAEGIPSYLTGDFNAPSFRDWTPATVGFLNRPYALRWPVSVYVEGAGFRDSYREVYPNPLADPGITWPSGRPHEHGVWNPPPTAPKDRIDLIYEAGASRAVASQIAAESADPNASFTVDPWGSDHRAVMSTFVVHPSAPPVLVAVADRLIDAGRTQHVTFHAPAGPGRIVVSRGGTAVASRSTDARIDGSVAFPTGGWRSGAYRATLVVAGRDRSSIPFWVQPPGGRPSIRTSSRTYGVGVAIHVRWRDAPGERWDWVGVYRRGADPLVASYLTWAYTKASITTGTTLDGTVAYGTWPLARGRYSLYLLADDGYAILARTTFSIR